MPRRAAPKPTFIIELDETGRIVTKHQLDKNGNLTRIVNPKTITIRTKFGVVPNSEKQQVEPKRVHRTEEARITKKEIELKKISYGMDDLSQIFEMEDCDIFRECTDLHENLKILFDLI